MAANELEISFLGNADPLDKAAKEASKSLDQVSKAADNAEKSLGDLPKVQQEVANQAQNMAKQAAAAGGAIAKTAQNTRVGTQAFTNFGRVVQDLPFGPGGIANNLEAVALSMKSLREESAATGKSIGSILLQSLKGGGGLIAGISLLSAGLSFVTFGMQAWTRIFPDANEKLKTHAQLLQDAKKALEEYAANLDDVTKSRLQGAQNAQEELIRLKTLYDATQNANIPLAERRKLVDQLQEQYPKYFKNISDEIILAGGAQKAYENLTQAILAMSRVRAAQKMLDDLSGQLLTMDQQLADAGKNIEDQFKAFGKVQAEIKKGSADNTRAAQTGNAGLASLTNLDELTKAEGKYTEAVKKSSDINEQRRAIIARQVALTKELNATVQKNPEALLDPGGGLPTTKSSKDKWVMPIGDMIEFKGPIDFDRLQKIIKADIEQRPVSMMDAVQLRAPIIVSGEGLEIDIDAIIKRLKVMLAAAELAKRVNDAINHAIEGVGTGLGEAIGDAISGKGFGNAFKSIVTTVGDFVQSLGKMLIQSAVVVKAFKEVFSTLLANPGAALAVGVGMIAVGAIIKNMVLPKTPHLAKGGLATGATMAMVGEGPGTSPSNPEVIAPLDRLKDIMGSGGGFPSYLPVVEFSYDQVRLMYKLANEHGGLVR